MKTKILLIEDEPAIRNGLLDVFLYHGYAVEFAARGREGLTKALSGQHDLILLDVMLPEIDGFEICRRIREQDKEQPIIMLTAKSHDEDVVNGLTLGADDYVAKPFSVAQLVLRVEAVLRRSGVMKTKETSLEIGSLTIDTVNLVAQSKKGAIEFTRREVQLIQYLIGNKERPVSREELLTKVWGYDRNTDIETRTVDIHIAKIRKKIEADSQSPRFLLTVRGEGYRMNVV